MQTLRPLVIGYDTEALNFEDIQGVNFENQGESIVELYLEDILIKSIAPGSSWGLGSANDSLSFALTIKFVGSGVNKLMCLKIIKQW